MKLLKDLEFSGKRVFVRADLDVPIENSHIKDQTRLLNLVKTISFLSEENCKIIIAGHIGRPQGKRISNLSTNILVGPLGLILNKQVVHSGPFLSSELVAKTLGLQRSQILLLENLRFFKGEEENDTVFASTLISLADCYVNEAFAASHRKHTSIVGVPKLLPHAAGFRMQKEVEVLGNLLKNPQRPLVVVIGGAKIETKLPVIERFSQIADFVLVGGKLPKELGSKSFGRKNNNLILGKLNNDEKDLSLESIEEFVNIISQAKTILWNGPMGVFEEDRNTEGTKRITTAIAQNSGEKIVGGGETIEALNKFGLLGKMTFVSQGGGAMLEFLVKGTLPGIEALA